MNDRRTPLGELNWIFTSITDTIAWSVLPRSLFKLLFRQDLMVAALFRNFLLAERILRSYHCTPVSHPALPSTHHHPLWNAWDLAVDMCLAQLPKLLDSEGARSNDDSVSKYASSGDGNFEYQPSLFFAEQLTAFEVWLERGSPHRKPPEQLPIVLQVLLSQVGRVFFTLPSYTRSSNSYESLFLFICQSCNSVHPPFPHAIFEFFDEIIGALCECWKMSQSYRTHVKGSSIARVGTPWSFSGYGSLGRESCSCCWHLSVRFEITAESGCGTQTNFGLYLGETAGGG